MIFDKGDMKKFELIDDGKYYKGENDNKYYYVPAHQDVCIVCKSKITSQFKSKKIEKTFQVGELFENVCLKCSKCVSCAKPMIYSHQASSYCIECGNKYGDIKIENTNERERSLVAKSKLGNENKEFRKDQISICYCCNRRCKEFIRFSKNNNVICIICFYLGSR